MRETSKCHEFRIRRGDFDKYLHGKGIDIGAGPDPLQPPNGTVRVWDVADGDAQLMSGVPDEEFDFVYSSHCLEHLWDVPQALKNWVRILKPGGWLYLVVPDYVLYEKMTWPSRYNRGHKHSFSFLIPRSEVARPNHWHMNEDFLPLLQRLGVGQLSWKPESLHFNFNAGMLDQTQTDAIAQICIIGQKEITLASL